MNIVYLFQNESHNDTNIPMKSQLPPFFSLSVYLGKKFHFTRCIDKKKSRL